MVPRNRLVNSELDGVQMEVYPPPLDSSPIYQNPNAFIKVSADMLGMPVSPNCVLGQVITLMNNIFPKFIVLRERLLLKLEVLLERLNEQGLAAGSLAIVSGYLSPAYNDRIQSLEHSRHIYGGAATLIIDSDGNGLMNDLNGDSKVDQIDDQVPFDIIDQLYSKSGKQYLQDGLYLYANAPDHGPMVMIDARGFRKRWGTDEAPPPTPEKSVAKPKGIFR
jgi:hypothetical protein